MAEPSDDPSRQSQSASSTSLDPEAIIQAIARDTHTAYVLTGAAALENDLQTTLKDHMPNMSNRLAEKMFSGYGPLSSFSAKIDIAYALGIIAASARRDFHIIREVRNLFAHSDLVMNFQNEEVIKLLRKFDDFRPEKADFEFYWEKIRSCSHALPP